jgi:hypothetical protein
MIEPVESQQCGNSIPAPAEVMFPAMFNPIATLLRL